MFRYEGGRCEQMLHKKQKRENTDKERESRAREDDVVDVVLHLLPRPAALAGGAVGGRDRDRAGDQEERKLLTLVLARWLMQKIAAIYLEIKKYGAKRGLEPT